MSRDQQSVAAKVGLLQLATQLGNVSQACRDSGYSRDSYYRFKKRYETGGEPALQPPSKRQPVLKNRILPEIEAAVVDLAIDEPTWGRAQVANELAKRGLTISPAGVRYVWLRHDAETTAKRLNALAARVPGGGVALTPAQMAALENRRVEREANGDVPNAYPGYCGVQDTLPIGMVEGIGRLYQQTFIDPYSQIAFAKIYDSKAPWTAMDLLHDRVLPFFEVHGIPLCRVLTDLGTEYCRRTERPEDALYIHEYEVHLAFKKIQRVRTRTKNLQRNGSCGRFHETVLKEFYPVALRTIDDSLDELRTDALMKGLGKRSQELLYRAARRENVLTWIDELQAALDAFLVEYNGRRPQLDPWGSGKTQLQTFLEGVPLAKEKMLAA